MKKIITFLFATFMLCGCSHSPKYVISTPSGSWYYCDKYEIKGNSIEFTSYSGCHYIIAGSYTIIENR